MKAAVYSRGMVQEQEKDVQLFFDELAKVGLGKSWRFTDVKHLAFKRGRDEEDEEKKKNTITLEELEKRFDI